MKVSIVRAMDQFTSNSREHLKPVIIDTFGEVFQEDEDYLILRTFNCYNKESPDDDPNERFSGIVKTTILKRIDIIIDLENERIIV